MVSLVRGTELLFLSIKKNAERKHLYYTPSSFFLSTVVYFIEKIKKTNSTLAYGPFITSLLSLYRCIPVRYSLEGAQAVFNELAVAFDCYRAAPSSGGVQRLTGRPRPRLPIPRAKTGALALHMGGAWVLAEAAGSATLEAAARSTQGRGGAQWPSLSPPGTPSRPEPPGAHWGGAGAELKPGGPV